MLGRHVQLHADDKDLIEDLILNNEQLIEGGRSSVKSIVNIREAYSTIASTNLNRTMKILTAATVLIALPNVFFGMYGMNVILPFADQPWAYFLVVGVTIVVTIAVVMLARARRVF